jgi:hypothetical protein
MPTRPSKKKYIFTGKLVHWEVKNLRFWEMASFKYALQEKFEHFS